MKKNINEKLLKYDIYPMTLIVDRYGGSYSNAKFTAWDIIEGGIPRGPEDSDIECMEFWSNWQDGKLDASWDEKLFCGKGDTPNEAVQDLIIKVNK